ncbi:MAG TPA: ribosome-associated translation inhibitor RaiA [Clostridia bacterium]|nr:ribosome-associated translation inhibitor RaiA [Clostridia bacterium]HRU85029.1 ribosome-associated translation inhibitor RaiA [Eubacteriales bacterium]
MNIEFVGKNYDVSEKLKTISAIKLAKLDKYFKDDASARIVVTLIKHLYKSELTIFFGGRILRAEESSESPFDNLDQLVPKIEGQIRKYRTKLSNNLKEVPVVDEVRETKKVVAKTKTYNLKAMPDEAAISELDLLDQGFYIYLDDATGKVKVAYNRKDGNVGIIICNY